MVGDLGKFELTTITGNKITFYDHKTYGMQTDDTFANAIIEKVIDPDNYAEGKDYIILDTKLRKTGIRRSQILKIEFMGMVDTVGGEE